MIKILNDITPQSSTLDKIDATNGDSSSAAHGKVVYISSVGAANPTFLLAANNNVAKFDAVGVINGSAIGASASGVVQLTRGKIVDSSLSLSAGLIYVGTAGGITQTKPTSTGAGKFDKIVGKAITTTAWDFNPDEYVEVS